MVLTPTITEVLPDCHQRLWVTIDHERTLHVQLHLEHGPEWLFALKAPHVFKTVSVTDDGQALVWMGGGLLTLKTVQERQASPFLTQLGEVPFCDRYRPLLPLLRHCTPGIPLRQPERHHVMQMFNLAEGLLRGILDAYPVPEDRMLHRLHDIGLCLRYHLFGDLPAAILRRPWPYASLRCPDNQFLDTMQSCMQRGRLDLIEDPLWALIRGEVAG